MPETLFFHDDIPLHKPEDVIPFLARQERHWKAGRSAYELAHSWMGAGGVPELVRRVLDRDRRWAGARLQKGLFEKDTDLGTPGKASQTDLLAFVDLKDGQTGVLGVEGKAGETFGPIVEEWLPTTRTGAGRLAALCDLLQLDTTTVSKLRYQLFHRTVAAILEAQAANAPRAIMLVHSFAEDSKGFADLQAFAAEIGSPVVEPGKLSAPVTRGGIDLQLAWVQDRPLKETGR